MTLRLVRLIVPIVAYGLLSCSDFSDRPQRREHALSGDVYFPILGDTFSFYGTCFYQMEINNRFDTLYYDTVKVYKQSNDSFCYDAHFFYYEPFETIPGEIPIRSEYRLLTDRNKITADSCYKYDSDGDWGKYQLSIAFPSEDSVIIEEYRTTILQSKTEKRIFKGKRRK